MRKFDKKINKKSIFFRLIAFAISLFYCKSKVIGLENVKEPCVIITNHSKLCGPINAQHFFPLKKVIWCDAPMLDKKEFPAYAYSNFFNGKPTFFNKLLAKSLAPLVAHLFKNADTLPVYRDMRIVKTYKMSVQALNKGICVFIMPESPIEHNEIINVFNEYFVDIARYYNKEQNKLLKFVPMYYSPKLKIMVFGKAIEFNTSNKIEDERKRICTYLMEQITVLAKSLPKHKVVPFNNLKRKEYKYSKWLK